MNVCNISICHSFTFDQFNAYLINKRLFSLKKNTDTKLMNSM